MSIQELEQIIEAQREHSGLDFKADSPWDCHKLVKDMLAMSNVRDGGLIVVGVDEQDNRFVKQGVSQQNIATYQIDIMKDQLYRFTDPAIDFRLSVPEDTDGRKFVVIEVLPFKEVPVISKASIPGMLVGNTIYYRNTNKRIESAPVSNSSDLRDIIEWSAVRLMQKRRQWGYSVEPGIKESMDKERKDTANNIILDKIVSRCYWEFNVQPLQPQRIELLMTWQQAIERSQVRRNWVFPYLPVASDNGTAVLSHGSYLECASDFGARKEVWRAYKSGQFVSFDALPEDWYVDDPHFYMVAEKIPAFTYVTYFTSIIHQVTAAVEFISRLTNAGLFAKGLRIVATLHNCKGRKLYLDDLRKVSFFRSRSTAAPSLSVEKEVLIEEIAQSPLTISNAIIVEILDGFSFNPDPNSVMVDQHEYLDGRH